MVPVTVTVGRRLMGTGTILMKRVTGLLVGKRLESTNSGLMRKGYRQNRPGSRLTGTGITSRTMA